MNSLVALCLASSVVVGAAEEASPKKVIWPLNVAVMSPLELAVFAPKRKTLISVGALYVSEPELLGVQVSLLMASVQRDMSGIQVAPFISGGRGTGLVVSGFLTMTNECHGICVTPIMQDFRGSGSGLHLGLVVNGVANEFTGLQLGLFNRAGSYSVSLDQGAGPLPNTRRVLTKTTTYRGARLRGAQIGAFNDAQVVMGGQVGVLNLARELNGVQIGLINYARRLNRGFQIGAINIALEGAVVPFLPLLNVSAHW